jgi:hypothetical protein
MVSCCLYMTGNTSADVSHVNVYINKIQVGKSMRRNAHGVHLGGIKLKCSSRRRFLDFSCLSLLSIPVDARAKASVCGRSLSEVAGSNPTGGMNVCLLGMLFVVRKRFLHRADKSFRGVLPR